MTWFPLINTCLLFVLVVTAGWFFWRRAKDLDTIEQQNGDLLNMLKTLVAELRLRPCVMQKVDYPTDLAPKEPKERRGSRA